MKSDPTLRRNPFLFLLLVVVVWSSAKAKLIDAGELTTPQNLSYSVEEVIDGATTEYRFKLDNRHFATLIDQGGTYVFRPHPGCDINGWGSTWYAQPFLPGAELKHTTFGSINVDSNGIQVSASGMVSRGIADTYGTWGSVMDYVYDPAAQVITGTGQYTITLAGPLSADTGDLNLFKIASNYLDEVPLLSGGSGDTGDMKHAVVRKEPGSIWFIWIPPDQPSHFPTDKMDYLSIDVVGQYNNVDTAALGYEPIEPAYKPGLKVDLTSQLANAEMMFGGFYNLTESQCFWCDNAGITPLISKTSSNTVFRFDVLFESAALETCVYLPLMMREP
ncbi:MAG: hypothetical protein MUO62_07630 [Anaerolineales bacterium]|nr:hypothetical protein [Anaerolineales bacterium]